MSNIESIEGNALSGEYRHDNAQMGIQRLDFDPRRYDYVEEGYSLIHHEIFRDAEDSIMANHSKLDLTAKKGMEGMAVGGTIDQADLVIYTMLMAHNGKYLRVMPGKDGVRKIFAVGNKGVEYDGSYMFKILKKKGYFEIMNGNLHCCVNPENMDILVMKKPAIDQHDLFKFGITRYKNSEEDRKRILIYSMMNQPWGMDFEHPFHPITGDELTLTKEFGKQFSYKMVETVTNGTGDAGKWTHWIPYTGVKRFWSPYDGPLRENIKPLYIDDTPNKIKSIGILWKNKRMGLPRQNYYTKVNGKYTKDNVTYKNASNNYIMLMSNGSMADEDCILMGYDGKIRWVQYHNEFYDKFFNQTMTPKEVVDGLKPNFLVDLPYETQIVGTGEEKPFDWLMDTKSQRLDLTQTKNTVTPNLEYARKAEK